MEKIPRPDDFTIVGNFPYNISSQILFKVLDWKESVQAVVGMFQKEWRNEWPPGKETRCTA